MVAHRRRALARILEPVGLLLLLLVPVHLLAPAALGFQPRSGDQITIGAGEIISDDLYLAGQSITVDGTIQGDLAAAGQTVTVNGDIEGGLIAAAQTVIVNGTVRDTARVAAQAVVLQPRAQIGRDLVAFAYSIESQPGSIVGRDMTVAGYQALIAGTAQRNVAGGLAGLEVRGTVGGDVNMSVGGRDGSSAPRWFGPNPTAAVPSVPPGLTVADTARIGGHLTYDSPQSYPIQGQVAQGVTWNERVAPQPEQRGFGAVVADNVRRLIVLGVIALLLLWLVPHATRGLIATIEARPLSSLGWGIVAAFAAVGVIIGVLALTFALAAAFGGLTLGSLAGLVVVLGLVGDLAVVVGLAVFVAFVAQALVSYLTGHALLRWLRPDLLSQRFLPLLVGLPVFVILTAIPGIGGLIALLAALAALGAVWIMVRDRGQPAEAAVPVVSPEPAAA